MWILKNPTLESAKADVQRLIQLNASLRQDEETLKQLYQHYYDNGGYVTDEEHDAIPTDVQDDLYSLYDRTQKSGSLYDIRLALLSNADKCPYCSINRANELDHYMHKARYKALSVCRLNLVPLCHECNGLKSSKPYTSFVHPYFFRPEVAEFIVAEITIDGLKLAIKLSISPNVNPEEKCILEKQIQELNLTDRISYSINDYLGNLFHIYFVINSLFKNILFSNDRVFKYTLRKLVEKEGRYYGETDWRTVVLRGLINCPDFTVKVAKNICHYDTLQR